MKNFLLNIPVTFKIQDIDVETNEPINQIFEVTFRSLSKKNAKKITPKELEDLFKRSHSIVAGEETATQEEINTIMERINELKDKVILKSFEMQIFGEDKAKLLEFSEENDCVAEIVASLRREAEDIKKKQ